MDLIDYDLTEPRLRYPGRKGIYPKIEDYDEMYRRLEQPPVLANDLDLTTEEGQRKFNMLVYSKYDSDVFSNIPSCPCKHTQGGDRIGDTCPQCGFACYPITSQTISPIIWVRTPDQIPAFINVTVYGHLKAIFTKGGFSCIDWLMDPKYRPPRVDCPEEILLNSLGMRRGMKYFHDNFDDIMLELCTSRRKIDTPRGRVTIQFTTPTQGRRLLTYLASIREKIFCKYLPFPSKIGFIVEDVGDRTFVDPKMGPALNALIAIANAGRVGRSSLADVESRVARSISKLKAYYTLTESNKIFDKKGIYRKLCYGFAPHWSLRTVITSNHKVHDHESLHIPWGAAVLTFKLHIANKLLKEKYTPNQIFTMVYDNTLRTHHKLEKIFDQLIAETPNGRGIPCTFTRFPSLKRGSTQRFFIDHIKRDPTQVSTSLSPLCLKQPNADFDGDYMSLMLALDNFIAKAFDRLAPHTGLMDLRKPFGVSDHAMIPAPTLSTINHRLEVADDECVPYSGG